MFFYLLTLLWIVATGTLHKLPGYNMELLHQEIIKKYYLQESVTSVSI
jgi:hypothetical protein